VRAVQKTKERRAVTFQITIKCIWTARKPSYTFFEKSEGKDEKLSPTKKKPPSYEKR